MFNIGSQEMVLVLVIALIVFGPRKLPEIGRTLGRTLRELKRASNELMYNIQSPMEDAREHLPLDSLSLSNLSGNGGKKDGDV